MTDCVCVLSGHLFYILHCFSFPPFGSAVLEPNLKQNNKHMIIIIIYLASFNYTI